MTHDAIDELAGPHRDARALVIPGADHRGLLTMVAVPVDMTAS